MVIKILPIKKTRRGHLAKLANVEFQFTEGPLTGMKLIGTTVVEAGGEMTVHFPMYWMVAKDKPFYYLRPTVIDDLTALDRLRDVILDAYDKEVPE